MKNPHCGEPTCREVFGQSGMALESPHGGVAHPQAACDQGVIFTETDPVPKAHFQHITQQGVSRSLG